MVGCAQKRGPNEPEPIDLIPGIAALEVDEAAVFVRRDLSRPMSALSTRVNGVDFTQAQMRVGAALEVIDASGSSTYELVATERRHAIFKQQTVSGLSALNYDRLDPWELTPASATAPILQMPYGEPKRAAWEALNPLIGKTNADAIKAGDLVVAVLDGTDVDSGTASEIGYAFAFDKQILGYRGDFRLSADNECSTVNRQVEYLIRQSGGKIIRAI